MLSGDIIGIYNRDMYKYTYIFMGYGDITGVYIDICICSIGL